MITVLTSLGVLLLAGLAAYIHRLAELTSCNSTLRESLKGSCAVALLQELEGSSRSKTYQTAHGKLRREYEITFVQRMMPILFNEARDVTLAVRSPLALLHFGLFCLAYLWLWAKVRLHADIEDLRILVGTEMLLLRRSARLRAGRG